MGPVYVYSNYSKTVCLVTVGLACRDHWIKMGFFWFCLFSYKLDGAAAGAIFNAAITDLRIKFYSELFGRVDLVT